MRPSDQVSLQANLIESLKSNNGMLRADCNDPHIQRMLNSAAHNSNEKLVKDGILPDADQIFKSLTAEATKSESWEGNACIDSEVEPGYSSRTNPAQRHKRALDDAVQWLLHNPSVDINRIHLDKEFKLPDGHTFKADIAYQMPDGKWKIYKVEEAGNDQHGHKYRDQYEGNTTIYWRQIFDWIKTKGCPIEVMEIIDVNLKEPVGGKGKPHAKAPGQGILQEDIFDLQF